MALCQALGTVQSFLVAGVVQSTKHCRIPSLTHNFVTHHLSHTTLLHTTLSHTTPLQPQLQLVSQLSAQSNGGARLRALQSLHANKIVRMPDPFTAFGAEAEQTAWSDFELNFLAWLRAADAGFETDLEWISEHVDTEFDMDVHSNDMTHVAKSSIQFWLDCCAIVLSRFCLKQFECVDAHISFLARTNREASFIECKRLL